MAKTEETPIVRRSTYVEPETPEEQYLAALPDPEPSAELKRIIDETRSAQVEELREQLAEAQDLARARLEIIENISEELAKTQQALEDLKTEAEETDGEEESPINAYVRILSEHLNTYTAGPTAILHQMERRGAVERAGYLASIARLAARTQEQADTLHDLRNKSEIAGHMLSAE